MIILTHEKLQDVYRLTGLCNSMTYVHNGTTYNAFELLFKGFVGKCVLEPRQYIGEYVFEQIEDEVEYESFDFNDLPTHNNNEDIE